ncbi:MAG: hypothetical protein DMG84_02215 [Acidobacteria bacterium]|nr:MAG: hypothetical protein DMG84_02215 [Acidobacteriota bacterium]
MRRAGRFAFFAGFLLAAFLFAALRAGFRFLAGFLFGAFLAAFFFAGFAAGFLRAGLEPPPPPPPRCGAGAPGVAGWDPGSVMPGISASSSSSSCS